MRSDDHDNSIGRPLTSWGDGVPSACDDTRLRGSYGTGLQGADANQLYTQSVSSFRPFSGNPNLTPETSRGWELGADQPLAGEQLRLGLTITETVSAI